MADIWAGMQQNQSRALTPEEQLMAEIQSQGQAPVTPIPTGQENADSIQLMQSAPMRGTYQKAAPLNGVEEMFREFLAAGKDKRKKSEAYRKQEEAGIGSLEKLSADFRDPSKQQMNLQPLLAFADFMNDGKTNLAANYKGPMDQDQRLIMAAKLEEALQNRRGNLSQHAETAAKDQQQAAKDLITLQMYLGKSEKGKTLSGAEVDKISEAQNALDMVKGLKNVISANEGLLGTAGAAKASDATKLWAGTVGEIPILGEALGAKDAGEKERQVQAQFNTAKQKIAYLMEKGVLRKEDEPKYDKILPNISDSPAVANSKQQTFEKYLGTDLKRHITNLSRAGYDMSNFSDIGSDESAFPGNLGMDKKPQAAAAPKAPPVAKLGAKMKDREGNLRIRTAHGWELVK